MAISLSVVIPAHKEAGNLRGTVEYVTENMIRQERAGKVTAWEIIIVDAFQTIGTGDGTPELSEQLAGENPDHVRFFHCPTGANLGYKYWQGLDLARFGYLMMVPGKNTLHSGSIENLLSDIPPNGMVVGYQADMSRRPFRRRLISKSFTLFINLVFNLNLAYYNGSTVIPTALLRQLKTRSEDFAYMAEVLVILKKKFHIPHTQAAFYTRGRRVYGKTQATQWSNVQSVARTILRLVKQVYLEA